MNKGINFALVLIVAWVAGLGVLLLLKSSGAKKEKYDFPYKTQISESACNNGYTDIVIGGLDEARKYSLRGLNVSQSEISRFSIKCHNQIKDKYSISSHKKLGTLNDILSKMEPFTYANLDYEVYVVRDESINAFTIAGGKIYFTTGLLEFVENDDELAAIMGHEVGHNENGHCIQYLQKKRFWEEFLPDIEIWDIKLSDLAELITNIEELITISFNQEDEKCADLCGAYLTYKAGYDPEIGKDVFAKFRKLEQSENRRAVDKFFRSHPYSEDRYFCLKEYIDLAEKNALRSGKKSESTIEFLNKFKWSILFFLIIGTIASSLLFWFTFIKNNKKNTLSSLPLVLYSFSLIYLLSLPSFGIKFGPVFENKEVEKNKIIVGQKGKVKTKGGRLLLRKTPSLSGEEITRMPPSSIVDCDYCCCDDEVYERKGKWCWVKYKNFEGYAWGWYIQLE